MTDTTANGGEIPPQRMQRAGEIFLEVREQNPVAQDEAVDRLCAGDMELEKLVRLLLRGDKAPLPVQSLAEDIRAAHEARPSAVTAPETGPSPAASGERIGNYRVLERLGEGGFGVVYLAEQERPVKRRVAIKIIKLGMDTKQVIARFEAERQALAMMDHTNIAKVFDAGATPTGRPYFVMELVRGMPITEYCDQRKLDIPSRLELFAQVCDAVQHAHQKGVIHRDIKPSNVLVTEMGDRAVTKVIDFGIAKATGAELTAKTIFTEMRQMIGTPEYMSPEQAGISGLDIDTRSDVYSLGVLLYELLTGLTPFDSARLRSMAYGEIQRILREEDPPRPSTRLTKADTRESAAAARGIQPARLGSLLTGELDWVVMKCLEKDRNRRYESAGALMRDVRRYVAGEAVQAVPPSAGYRLRKYVRKHKGPAVAGLLVSLALVVGLVGTSMGFFNAARQRTEAEQQRDLAQVQKDRADAEASEARTAEALANRKAYSADLLSACTALAADIPSTAKLFLDDAPEALRGWEWRVLHSQLDTSVRAVAMPPPTPERRETAYHIFAHPDGKSFFAVNDVGSQAAQHWDVQNGTLLATYDRPDSAYPPRSKDDRQSFALSPDGSRLSLAWRGATSGEYGVVTWDVASARVLFQGSVTPAHPTTCNPCISPDGTRLVLTSGDGLWLQDTATGGTIATAQSHGTGTLQYFSPNGALLATTGARGAIDLFDGHTLAHIARLEGHRNMIGSMAFSPDGQSIVSGSLDFTARIWDLRSTPPTSIVLDHPGTVNTVLFSPDASLVATECVGIKTWDARSGELVGTYASASSSLSGPMMFLPDGQSVAKREGDGTLRFWDVASDPSMRLRGHQGLTISVRFAAKPGLIVSTGWDGWASHVPGCVRFWDSATGDEVATFGVANETARCLAVSQDGSRAALSITHNPPTNRGVIIDLGTGRTVDLPRGAGAYAFNPSAELLAVGRPGRVEIVNAQTGVVVRSRTEGFEDKDVSGLEWSSDGRQLACNFAQTLPDGGPAPVILDAETLKTLHQFGVGPISLSPDATRIFQTTPEGHMNVFSADSFALLESVQPRGLPPEPILLNSNEARFAIRGPGEGALTVWNADTFDLVARFHEDTYVSSIAWSADGTQLAAGLGREIRVWDEVPLAERLETRRARRAAVIKMEPRINSLLAKLNEPASVIDRIAADDSLNDLERLVASQLVFREGLRRSLVRSASTPAP